MKILFYIFLITVSLFALFYITISVMAVGNIEKQYRECLKTHTKTYRDQLSLCKQEREKKIDSVHPPTNSTYYTPRGFHPTR